MQVLDKGFVELVDSMGDDFSVVDAARVSFNKDIMEGSRSFSEKDRGLIKYLLENGHTSPFEHVMFKFHVKCPLFIRSQWMRHRTGKYNEISRRYTSEDIDFYIPTELRKQSEDNKQASTDEIIKGFFLLNNDKTRGVPYAVEEVFTHMAKDSLTTYNFLIENGVAREQARMILPQNMYTRFYFTIDLHNLLHFLEVRNHSHAQYEMRLYAKAIEEIIEDRVPVVMEVWRELHGD